MGAIDGRKVNNPKVPADLGEAESKPKRDDEKGDRPTIELGNRDRGPEETHQDNTKPEGRGR